MAQAYAEWRDDPARSTVFVTIKPFSDAALEGLTAAWSARRDLSAHLKVRFAAVDASAGTGASTEAAAAMEAADAGAAGGVSAGGAVAGATAGAAAALDAAGVVETVGAAVTLTSSSSRPSAPARPGPYAGIHRRRTACRSPCR